MKNIFDTVADLLLTNDKYKAEDGKLLKAVVYSDVMGMSEDLLILLLSNEDVKETFFKDVQGTLVFDKQKFAWFMESKEFLPDSYTAYTNKIGLTHNGSFISQTNDVVLDFPYKDCVLEGGQDKDDQKRSEIFYNETIASDEISCMLAPKVFTNAKRYTAVGEKDLTGELDPNTIQVEEETGIMLNDDDNLIIKGNNLIALASLLKRYEGKVKCIYIDPPYNTQNDSFNYNDSFNHSTWLTFMKNRLELAKRLLREDGSIFVQCDDNEQAYLKVLMDDIFSTEKFVSTIHCQMSTTQGMKVRSAQLGNIVKNGEYIHVYSKDGRKNIAVNPLYDLRQEYDEHYDQFIKNDGTIAPLKTIYDYSFPKDLNNKKALTLKEAFAKSEEFADIVRSHLADIVRSHLAEIVIDDKITSENITDQLQCGKYKKVTKNGKEYLLTLNSKGRMRQLLRLSDSWGQTDSYKAPEGLRKIRGDWWEGFYLDMGNVTKEGNSLFQNGKKPERLISQIIKMVTNPSDLVLDFHLGSGTTAAVAHKMGRRYIGVEQMDYIQDITVERLKKVLEGEQGGISKAQNWHGGGSFVYCELKEDANMLINTIQKATEDTIESVKAAIYANERIVPYLTKQELADADKDFENLTLEEKKQALIKLVDKNKLYVNASDMDDESYHVSDDDKKFTNSFYKGV
ncbi:MAG: site-specific DNA-methyltransferase [Lactobacillus iners]|nr:site-specific DNA-methyltransferase [Lactobacillus iners]